MKAYSRGLSAVTQYKFVMYLPPTHGRDWCTTWFCRVLWCPSKNTKSPSVSTHFNGVAFYLPCRSYFSVAVILRASVLHEKEKDRCLHTSTENGKRKTKIGLMLQNNFCAFFFFNGHWAVQRGSFEFAIFGGIFCWNLFNLWFVMQGSTRMFSLVASVQPT